MTITTYAELKASIQSYGKRTDALSELDGFIDLCETDIANELRVREMEARATAATPTTDRFMQLPTGFLKMRRLRLYLSTGEYADMEFSPADQLMHITQSAGLPWEFAVGTQLEFNRTPDQAYTAEMKYWRKLTGLSSSNTTNAILDEYPFIYLAGCMKYFYVWAKSESDQKLWEAMFSRAIAEANNRARKGRYGPAPAAVVDGMVV